MKKSIILFAAIAMTAIFTNQTMAQATVTGTTAGAKILVPITLTETGVLHFGTMYKGTGGTCVLATDGTRSFTGGVTAAAVAPFLSNATYDVTGAVNTTYAITLPASVTVTETVGLVATMTINAMTVLPFNTGANAVTGTLSGTGLDNLTVGGTLTVAGTQATGIYAGTFDVTVAYN